MGLFSKVEKNPKKNEIGNTKLKDKLENKALKMLKKNKDYKELTYMACEFGYLFMVKGYGLEALFKITTNKGTFYFLAQGHSFRILDGFNEIMFKSTTDKFLSLQK